MSEDMLSDASRDNFKGFDQDALIQISNMSVQEAESRFSQAELSQIRREFEKNSKDQIIGKRKLIEYFRLTEVQDSYLSNELFNVIKNSQRLNHPIDYQKFISFIAVLVKGSQREKLLLIFSIFGKGVNRYLMNLHRRQRMGRDIMSDSNLDHEESSYVLESEEGHGRRDRDDKEQKFFQSQERDSQVEGEDDFAEEDEEDGEALEPRVTKEDLKIHISGTILSVSKICFDDSHIEGLKQQICQAEETLIDDALDSLVEEIFDQYAQTSKDDGLSFDEWALWFTSLEGVNELLVGPSSVQLQGNAGY
uniref:Uncharacterized protein n=1 Tax=Strombidium rassoulzadegani TaxID=1082188 RepID=A0A7S3CL33_9SPIT|mmetsp:Transcript_13111/g.22137  ORF Transcript_13111/g.22137 Transcript_13111/m.22137 type:complete len:307 (+) Transcript_13111:197-1117(+)